jgi:hypothetical protein
MNAEQNDFGGDRRGSGASAPPPANAPRDETEPAGAPAPAPAEATPFGNRTVDDVAFELVVTASGLEDQAPCDGFYIAGPECPDAAHWARVCEGCRGTILSCDEHRRSWDEWVVKPPTGGRCTNCLTALGVPIAWIEV